MWILRVERGKLRRLNSWLSNITLSMDELLNFFASVIGIAGVLNRLLNESALIVLEEKHSGNY